MEIVNYSAAKNPYTDKSTRTEIGETDMNTGIREWYLANYPEDVQNGSFISPLVTFEDLWQGLNEGTPLYEMIDVDRETDVMFFVYSRLAQLKDVVIRQLYDLENDGPRLAFRKQLLDSGISFETFYMLRKNWDNLSAEDKEEITREFYRR